MKKSPATVVGTVLLILTLTLIPGFAPLQAADPLAGSVAPQAITQSGWEVFPSQFNLSTMYTLDMLDETEGWAAGPEGMFAHYHGDEWANFSTTFRKVVNGLSMISATSGWGVTHQGDMLRFDDTSWSVHSQPATSWLKDVEMLSETDGWAVGGVADGQSIILRYNAPSDSWQSVGNPGNQTLQAIDMVNASDGWAVGVGQTFLHWDGATWWGGSVGPGILWDVDMVSSTDGWAVGMDGLLYHYDENIWNLVSSPITDTLLSVSMIDASEGWAVGENGTIAHYADGVWEKVASPTTSTLTAVEMLSTTNGWAVGYGGVVLHYSGESDLSTSTKSVNTRYASPGEQLTYTISINNIGNAPAPGVVVTDTIPTDTTYVASSASTTQGAIQSTDPLVVDVGDVAPGSTVTINFAVTVDDPGQTCWFISNEAQIASGDTLLSRYALTTVGDCIRTFVPVVFDSFE